MANTRIELPKCVQFYIIKTSVISLYSPTYSINLAPLPKQNFRVRSFNTISEKHLDVGIFTIVFHILYQQYFQKQN